MEKTHLGGEHPDYHTLLAALTQILQGLILNALQIECGAHTLDNFAKTNPSPEEMFTLTQKVMANYTVPEPHFSATNLKVPLQDLNLNTGSAFETTDAQVSHDNGKAATEPDKAPNSTDVVYDNTILLTHDLMYAMELINTMSTGDFGCVEDILPTLACMFH